MKRDDLFERLDPPPGGLAKLRARIDARRSPRVIRFAVAFAALAAIVAFVLTRPRPPNLVARAHDEASIEDVSLGLARAPARPVALVDGKDTTALATVKTTDQRVVFVWIASTQ